MYVCMYVCICMYAYMYICIIHIYIYISDHENCYQGPIGVLKASTAKPRPPQGPARKLQAHMSLRGRGQWGFYEASIWVPA